MRLFALGVPPGTDTLHDTATVIASACSKCGTVLSGEAINGPCPKCKSSGTAAGYRDKASDEEGPQIDGYHLERVLGRGGMGVVWLAEQLATRQHVAVKLCARSAMDARVDANRLRFEREVSLVARLSHPNIARVYAGGEAVGIPYCVMEYVDGRTLGDHVKAKGLNHREIVELMQKICNAVQHAHQNGIIHRDLKPSNILVTTAGEPKVLDFGLAKALEGEEGSSFEISLDGQIIGTPRYMAPEQARGLPVDTRTDVYSLGVILYELLTSEHPQDTSGTWEALLSRVANVEPKRPRFVCRDLDAEIEMLLLKAIQKKPDERYRTAGELADDLKRWLEHEPLAAGRATSWYFARKWLYRHRVGSSITGILLALGLSAGCWYIHAIRLERDRANRARNEAERSLLMIGDAYENASQMMSDLLVNLRTALKTTDADSALAAAGRTVNEYLNETEPTGKDDDGRHMQSVVLNSRGYLALRQSDFTGAEKAYRESLALRRSLAAARVDDPLLQHNVAIDFDNLGDLHAAKAQDLRSKGLDPGAEYIEALRYYRESLGIVVALANRRDARPVWMHDLSVGYFKIGDIHFQDGDTVTSLDVLQKGLPVAEKVAASDPEYSKWQAHLGLYCLEIGRILALSGKADDARGILLKGQGIFNRLRDRKRLREHYAKWLVEIEAVLRDLSP